MQHAVGSRLASYLSKTLPGYHRHDAVSIEAIAAVLQPGDVVLVEGGTRISVAIKYLTQSSWSHSCLYVGEYGGSASQPNLLEADLQNGVRLVALEHYSEFNLRICRPVSLGEQDLERLIARAKAKLGHQYDLKNVVDLMRYLIQKPAVPNRYRRAMIGLGSGEPTRAICSTLLAEAFQSIDYPILPIRGQDTGVEGEVPIFYRRHFTHVTPRDFDLSPYFQVVKPTLEHGFNYRELEWGDSAEADLADSSE
ncbi:MAG: lipo-like protein [Gammaproteobacteria bacterium]|nr:lipo-like protein [Gammaproteobacteria bacterium]